MASTIPTGLDISRVVAWKAEHGTVVGFPGAQAVTNAEILEIECDVLIPGRPREPDHGRQRRAHQRQDRRRGGQRPDDARGGRDPLPQRGIFLIPDILCNAGGVTVSYFEWVQDLNRDHWSEKVVNEKLHEIMAKAFGETLDDRRSASSVHMRLAAYLLAVQRVADATAMRGLYP